VPAETAEIASDAEVQELAPTATVSDAGDEQEEPAA
jgi:hypothetical protein